MVLVHLPGRSARFVALKKIHICSLMKKKNCGHPLSNAIYFCDPTTMVSFYFVKPREFYGISDKMNPTLLLTRCKEGKKKNIYFTSPTVRDLTMMNADRVAVRTSVP